MKRAKEAKRKAEKVSHFLGKIAVKNPTKGEDIAYVAHISPKKYPKVIKIKLNLMNYLQSFH